MRLEKGERLPVKYDSNVSNLELEQRAFYLAQALTSARSADRISAEDVDFVNTVQERMDVSHVQLEVLRAIREHPDMSQEEKQEVLGGLNTRLVPLDSVGHFTYFFSKLNTSCSKTLHDRSDCLSKSCSS